MGGRSVPLREYQARAIGSRRRGMPDFRGPHRCSALHRDGALTVGRPRSARLQALEGRDLLPIRTVFGLGFAWPTIAQEAPDSKALRSGGPPLKGAG